MQRVYFSQAADIGLCYLAPQLACFRHQNQETLAFFFQKCGQNASKMSHTFILAQVPRFSPNQGYLLKIGEQKLLKPMRTPVM
ncbi:MAG: hypothetical protein V2G41_07655 [bacterium JZ-2024 1]